MNTKRVLIIKNCSREGPGLLEPLLREHRIPFLISDIKKGDDFPSPKNYGALIVLGGPQSANDSGQAMSFKLKRIKEALDLEIPFLGICLGLQMMVKERGGKVVGNRVKEIGFRDPEGHFFEVNMTDDGARDPLLKSLSDPFKIFQLHGETVELTPDMKLLGKGKFCQNQIVRAGLLAYGIQGHVELTPDLFQRWIREDPDLKTFSRTSLERDYTKIQNELLITGTRLFTNFLRLAALLN